MAKQSVTPEWLKYPVDHSDGDTTIYPGACLLRKVVVNETTNAAATILDGSSMAFILPNGITAGSDPDYGDVRIDTKLIFNAGSLGAGNVTFIYKPNHEGKVGDGY